MRLAGKVTLISGRAHGMGAAEARLFAREGAQVQTVSWVNRRGGSMPSPSNPQELFGCGGLDLNQRLLGS